MEQHIHKLKKLIKEEDDYYEIKRENYYEWAIENWIEIEKSSGLSPNFNIDGHEWKISVYPNESGFVKFELDNFNSYRLNDNEYFYVNYVFVIRNSNDFSCLKAKPSDTLKRFSKKEDKAIVDKFIRTEDLHNINENSTKPIVEGNKLVIGVYIRIYDKEQKINKELTSLLKNIVSEENCKIKEENYFEWRIDNWKENKNCWLYSPGFNIGGNEWYIRLNPDYNGYVHLKLEIRYSFSSKTKEKPAYANCVMVIHNINDIYCNEKKASTTMYKFDYNHWSLDFLKFIKREDLYIKKENSSRSLVENNKIAIGVYVRVYDKRQ